MKDQMSNTSVQALAEKKNRQVSIDTGLPCILDANFVSCDWSVSIKCLVITLATHLKGKFP